MARVTLTKQKEAQQTPFEVELIDGDTGERVVYKYKVRRLGGRAAMKAQLLQAEFARDKKRDEIVGSSVIQEILQHTVPVDKAPELIDLFDFISTEDLEVMVTELIKAAQANSVDAAAAEVNS